MAASSQTVARRQDITIADPLDSRSLERGAGARVFCGVVFVMFRTEADCVGLLLLLLL